MRTVVMIAMFSLSLVLIPYAPGFAAGSGKGALAVPKAAADKGKGAEKGKGADKAGKSDSGTKGQTKDSPTK